MKQMIRLDFPRQIRPAVLGISWNRITHRLLLFVYYSIPAISFFEFTLQTCYEEASFADQGSAIFLP